jgi:hypothetical protein
MVPKGAKNEFIPSETIKDGNKDINRCGGALFLVTFVKQKSKRHFLGRGNN